MKNLEPLGRGLQSLLPSTLDIEEAVAVEAEYFQCPISAIRPNPYQPRKEMDDVALSELADSIQEKGILQPLVVRMIAGEDGVYELIAGERRLRAAQKINLEVVPVLLKEASEEDSLELALIENIQRQNLNPLEEAIAYKQLVDEFGLTQENVAQKVGKKRSTVSNIMRLLALPGYIKDDLAAGTLSMGHTKVLLSIDNEHELKELRDTIIRQGLSVRQTEKIVTKGKGQKKQAKVSKKTVTKNIPDSYCRTLTGDITRVMGTKSRIVQNGERGKVEIEYYSLDDLERIHGFIIGLKGDIDKP